MRYAAPEKLEIIRLVEGAQPSARQTLAKLGIPRTTFYRWYDRYLQRGEAGLEDQSPKPKHVWKRIPDAVRRKVVKMALKEKFILCLILYTLQCHMVRMKQPIKL